MPSDVNWVLPQLAIGGRLAGPLAGLSSGMGISRVVDLRAEECDDPELMRSSGIELLCLPTIDHSGIAQDMIDAGVEWVNRGIEKGQRVLVHCEHGIGRSALLALCVLVSRGGDPLSAMIRLKRARPCVSPNQEQLEAFVAWSAARGQQSSWQELAAIVSGDERLPDEL